MPKNKNRKKFTEIDPKLKLLVKRRALSKDAKKNYNTTFNEICEKFEVTPSQIVEIGKKEQKPYKTDDGLIDILDLEDRTVTKIQMEYKEFLDEKGNAPRTKKLKLDCYRALLGEFNIEKPKPPKIKIKKDRIRESDIVSWRDVEKAMDISKGIRDKTIIIFLAVTGMRGIDLVNLQIKDLIRGCKIYFDEGEEHTLENLLKKDPKSIIPCYEIMPTKTDEKSQLAMTFNTPECSEYLWTYLKERIEKNGELSPDDPLFANRNNKITKIGSLEKMYQRINKSLGDEKDKNGVYGKFRKHSMRKLFSTTCRKNMLNISVNSDRTTEIDVVSIFTGHVPPNESNSKVYEAIPDDSEDSYLREIYFKLVPYLSIKDTEIHHINSKEVIELTDKIEILEKQNQQKDIEHQRDMDEKDKKIAELEQMVVEAKEEAASTKEIVKDLTQKRNKTDIRRSVQEHFDTNYREGINKRGHENGDPNIIKKDTVICELATEFALEDEKFSGTEEELDSVIKKAIATCSFNPEIVQEKYELIHKQNERKLEDATLISSIKWDIKIIISNHEEIWEMVKDDEETLDKTIINTLVDSDYDLNNLSNDDLEKISEEVIMDYLS